MPAATLMIQGTSSGAGKSLLTAALCRIYARRGVRVKEMLGGMEYWVREGFPVATEHGTTTGPVDPLTAPCGC